MSNTNNVITSRVIEKLAEYFPLKSDFDRALAQIRGGVRVSACSEQFSLSRMYRGLSAMQSLVINPETTEEDINYTKALATGATPGSYLVPTFQANEIIAYLTTAGVLRAAGVRVWPLPGVDKINIPVATAVPTVQYLGQNTAQTATDPNIGQISFSMKTARCLTAIPNELLLVSIPSIDALMAELLGVAFAEFEDAAFFPTSAVTNGPTPIYAASGTTVYNVGNSANGGNLTYNDLISVLWKSAAAKAKAPFVWIMSPGQCINASSAYLTCRAARCLSRLGLVLVTGFRDNRTLTLISNRMGLWFVPPGRCLGIQCSLPLRSRKTKP